MRTYAIEVKLPNDTDFHISKRILGSAEDAHWEGWRIYSRRECIVRLVDITEKPRVVGTIGG